MKPTIKMIADRAGVSRGTVDRVLHGRPNVHPEKRQRVLDVLKQLEYTPDPAARALALRTRGIKVGVLIPSWIGLFEPEVMRGIEAARAELQDYGLDVMVEKCVTEQPDECIEKLDVLCSGGVKGIAICAKNSIVIEEKLNKIISGGIPVVTFNSDIPKCFRLCFVGENPVRSGRVAGEIMSKLIPPDGHVLVVCGNKEFDAHKSRVDGFCSRWKERGRDARRFTVVESYNDYDLTFQKVSEQVADGHSIAGVYMAAESVSGCVEALRRAGCIGKVRVVCHDLSESTSRFLREGAVDFAIEQNLYRQGFMPVNILADYLIADKLPSQKMEYPRIHIATAENID